MATSFSITTPSNSVQLGSNSRGQAVFTVTNISGRINRGRVRVVSENTVAAPWLTLEGEAERDFPIAGTQQFCVAIAPPPKVPAGGYVFHLEVVGVENPDEDLTQGPTVTFQISAQKPRKFPWWVFIVAGVILLAIIALIVFSLIPKTVAVPDVSGIQAAAAAHQLQEAGFKVESLIEQPSNLVEKGLMLGTDPAAGTKIDPDKTPLTLIVSSGPLATATPTITQTPTNTSTWTPTPSITPSRTFTPSTTPSRTNTRTPTPTTLIAYFPLSSNANEANGLTSPMILQNAPFSSGGVFCNGVYSGASACKVSTPQLTSFNFNRFTISARFRATVRDDMPVYVGGRSYRWIGFLLYNNGHVGLLYNNSNRVECGQNYVAGTWYLATITYDGSTARLYLNNTLACSKSFAIVHGGDADIGTANYSNGTIFNGIISDLRIQKTIDAP